MGEDKVNDFLTNRKRIERRFRELHREDEIFFTTGNFVERVKEGKLDPSKHGSPWHYGGGLIVSETGLFFNNTLLAIGPILMIWISLMMVFMAIMIVALVVILIAALGLIAFIGIPIGLAMVVGIAFLGYMIMFQAIPRTHFFKFDELDSLVIEYREEKGRIFDLFTLRKDGEIFQIITFKEMDSPARKFLDAYTD